MAYYIMRVTTMEYVAYGKKKPFMTKDESQAHHFSNMKKAENFRSQTGFYDQGQRVRPSELKICEFGTKCETKQELKSESVCKTEPERKVEPKKTITRAEAEEYLNQLSGVIEQLREVPKIVRLILGYYSEQQGLADKAQEDLLHKIEFTDANAADGFKLYKTLQEVRTHRRECKDMCGAMLTLINGGHIAALARACTTIDNYTASLQTRHYNPRVLDELFDNNSSNSLSDNLGKVIDKITADCV